MLDARAADPPRTVQNSNPDCHQPSIDIGRKAQASPDAVMAPSPSTPKRTLSGRPRGRPRRSTNSVRTTRDLSSGAATEPPQKKRRYIPGGPGGGGRYIDDDEKTPQIIKYSSAPTTARSSAAHATPAFIPKRERSTRARTATTRADEDETHMTSASAVAAVVQNEGYKPREERGWEEFHPNLDIDGTFMVFRSEDVDGIAKPLPPMTPAIAPPQEPSVAGNSNPSKDPVDLSASLLETPNALSNPQLVASLGIAPGTSPRRRGRPPRYTESLFAVRPDVSSPKTPKPLPIHSQNAKEKLDLKQPSYRKTDRILLFESKTFGQARYVDKSMMNVGYQESDHYIRPDRTLIKASDSNVEEDADIAAMVRTDGAAVPVKYDPLGRVEYDMDEQDDMWLEFYNSQRKVMGHGEITREIFEITMTKIEKEWHALEKKIPKPNPKPPQTHRPRSSSAAAVNGEPQAEQEVDSKCAICDDGDCENTNAIVFCDGCDLAVHQECYGVPFIPEGQWLCRKCQLIGRGIPTCIFCPNTDGAFKQTNSSKWAHLLCAMWIPEISLGNHTFMEPVMEVEKVPKTRWRLTCYICQQKMGACIQCGNKACYQAFHVTCARRARLYLKMKTSQGVLAPLDGNMVLKALCDRHCPSDYAKENSVTAATRAAQKFYKKAMKGRIWATNQASARELAATHRNAMTEHPPDESQMTGAKLSGIMDKRKAGQPGKPIWKLPSGAPVIPQSVFTLVDTALQRFTIQKRRDFVGEACRYWTLKREARRGASLLKRLQLQMETFSSMELTRRNFAAMGPVGKVRLEKRIDFARALLSDLEHLKSMSDNVVNREAALLKDAETVQDVVDTVYFPVFKMLPPVLEKAFLYDKNVFKSGLTKLQAKLDDRFYTTTIPFAQDLCEVISMGINRDIAPEPEPEVKLDLMDVNVTKKNSFADRRDRKRLGKRIIKTVQPQLELALKKECEVSNKPLELLLEDLNQMIEVSLEFKMLNAESQDGDIETQPSLDIEMTDAPPADAEGDDINPEAQLNGEAAAVHASVADPDAMDVDAEGEDDAEGEPDTMLAQNSPSKPPPPHAGVSKGKSPDVEMPAPSGSTSALPNGTKASPTPPVNGTVPEVTVTVHPPSQNNTPPTPPQSNGSLGREPADPLTEGGVAWYLKGRFKLSGTEASEEPWAGRDAVRSLSEELTDIDDEEFRGLEETVLESPSAERTMANEDGQKEPATGGANAAEATTAGTSGGADGALANGVAAAQDAVKEEEFFDNPTEKSLTDSATESAKDEDPEKTATPPKKSPAPPKSAAVEETPKPKQPTSAAQTHPETPTPMLRTSSRKERQKSSEKEKEKDPLPPPTPTFTKKTTRSASASAAALAARGPRKGTRSSARRR
ncbi:hypothetical protein MKZ38_005398 [Zalerion maritima]|uniref:Bromodomain and PHD finger-containing protein n=1 Tax=Zalerion maritima TaxID=339359 RepID=A0AAD5RLD5_9PEZI|nr:hypothetical protein MKZ38_005398 [Zalerion maritima]